MPTVPILLKPGVDTQSTPALNAAAWNESENARFFQGLAQKSGGFELFTIQVDGAGRPTALRAWTALTGSAYLAIGSQERITLFGADVTTDITPLSKINTIPIDLSTVAESQIVTVYDPLNHPMVGDWFLLRAPITIGGIILDGVYRVEEVVDATHYTIISAVAAVTTVNNGGTARQFTAFDGLPIVAVDFDNHGLFSGQVVYIPEPVGPVGGLTLFGNYIVEVITPDQYTIRASSAATSTATIFEHSGNMALAFLTGLVVALSATVEPFDPEASHIYVTSGATTEPYIVGSTPTYVPGDILTTVSGVGERPTFTVTTTQVVVVIPVGLGTGGTPGVHTFQSSSGSGTPYQFTATVDSAGHVTGAATIITPGSYTTNPTVAADPVMDITNGTTVGVTVNLGTWPLLLTIATPGEMTTLPDNPVSTLNTGTGRGVLLHVGWDFGYAIGDTLTLVGGSGPEEPTFIVQTLNVARVAINEGGSGGAPGVHTFIGSSGTGVPFQFEAQVAADGSLTGATTEVTVPGSYTVAPVMINEAVTDITDGTVVGATVDVSMWPDTVSLATPGSMTTVPDNPVQTTGDGNGAELNVDWDYSNGVQNDLAKEYITLDNWGEYLVVIPAKGPVYVWRPVDTPTIKLQNTGSAPQANLTGFVAIQQQILVVLGTVNFAEDRFDPMLIRWSDAGDYTDFTPTTTNQSGSFRLQMGSTIVAGLPIAQRNLIWTDLGVYSMQYQGLPFVFAIQPIGVNCGLVGPHAMGTMGDVTLWMSQNQFFVITGGGAPQAIPCAVWDVVFPNYDKANAHLITCATNSYYGEIMWYVPQTDGTVTAARLNIKSGSWDYTVIAAGSALDRSAWIDQNVFGPPMGADPAGNVYRQETTRDANGEVLISRLLSGIAMIAEGEDIWQIDHIYPDIKFDPVLAAGIGTVEMTVRIYKDMQAAPRIKGPYLINARTRRIPCRGRGKGIQFEFKSDDLGSWWTLGRMQYSGFPDGKN